MSQPVADDEPNKIVIEAKREQSGQAVFTIFGSRSVIKCIGSLSVRLENLHGRIPLLIANRHHWEKAKQVRRVHCQFRDCNLSQSLHLIVAIPLSTILTLRSNAWLHILERYPLGTILSGYIQTTKSMPLNSGRGGEP